ncbi:ATP-grasp domain-containing protein [Campylobacter sp. MIT 21-1685]|uniref:ATP-grasp domain-containing protein n=1 Tax=unclassified Campylobacter TaxID=2593542 RepID=UPI00224A99A6|nr:MULTISPECIES: ATP-grasp domain-containing protein [unclassified Campylobacter]MCX2683086.1 ATP-grasp domain-containing protein [Campylobacter sp. MIT 21-1684]MCX2751368.1 ATP-grasp domain-containing protein [Campylobacter sp. MIT 21-1682]MCX2807567.1 ATP-grasp domain-containing protein [Campylobacter sp. MIT 21-1685]
MQKKYKNDFIILTCKAYPQGNRELNILHHRLNSLGFKCEFALWQELGLDSLNENYVLLPLGMWDYSLYYKDFLNFLEHLDKQKIRIFNSVATLRKNSSKEYLKILQNESLPVVPSTFLYKDDIWEVSLQRCSFKTAVIKPLVGQSGNGVRFLSEKNPTQEEFKYGAIVQPFIKSVREFGECSLVFFKMKFAYAVQKNVQDDWRANSRYQVKITPLACVPKKWIEIAKQALKLLDEKSLYARVDILPQKDHSVFLSEVELLEPCLYFSLHSKGLESFVNHLTKKL